MFYITICLKFYKYFNRFLLETSFKHVRLTIIRDNEPMCIKQVFSIIIVLEPDRNELCLNQR